MSAGAPLRIRLASLFYEVLLTATILAFGYLLPQMVFSAFAHTVVPGWLQWLHIYLLLMVYFGWQWSGGRRTLAMKTWRLRLVGENGQPLAPPQAILRYFWVWPSLLLGGIGIFWALFDRDGRFLHDRLAHTQVLRDPPPAGKP